MNRHDLDRARDALHAISPGLPRDEWVRVGMAAQAAGLAFDDFDAWSAQADNYEARAARDTWRSFKPDGRTGAGSLFYLARAEGWNDKGERAARNTAMKAPGSTVEQRKALRPGSVGAIDAWARFKPATAEHGYIVKKDGRPDGLRVVPEGDPLCANGESLTGCLAVPVLSLASGELVSVQFVATPETGALWKAKGKTDKPNLPGASMAGGAFVVGELAPGGVAYVCEGIATAWACWKASGAAAVVCFGWGRVRSVATELRKRDVSARLVLVPDVGKEAEAETIAREVTGEFVTMPKGWPQNADVNDLALRDGIDALEVLLSTARRPAIDSRLSMAFADELPDAFSPTDELVQGVLTAEGGSVLYGDSNSGKTFFTIDMAAAVARGADWMGKKTEQGMVIYLAAESPASVRSRLQAYQRHHGVKVPNFAIVQSPIDLFDGDADTDAVIQLVRQLEQQRGQRARLIVGDTLARLSAGANENAAQDMGLVVRRFDRIRTECKAHFLLVHHSGKAAAAGARGWSGIRAAVDTEIEVTDSPAGRCAEITKQRDLSTKGERIGFRLDTVHLGVTKWGTPATSCVVQPNDAPQKTAGKRISEVGGAVLEMLRTKGSGIKKREVVQHFKGSYDSSAVYRELKRLTEAGQVHECIGIVAIAGGAKGAN
jgi:putative DNA primase/helicase